MTREAMVRKYKSNPAYAQLFEWGKLVALTGYAQGFIQLVGLSGKYSYHANSLSILISISLLALILGIMYFNVTSMAGMLKLNIFIMAT